MISGGKDNFMPFYLLPLLFIVFTAMPDGRGHGLEMGCSVLNMNPCAMVRRVGISFFVTFD